MTWALVVYILAAVTIFLLMELENEEAAEEEDLYWDSKGAPLEEMSRGAKISMTILSGALWPIVLVCLVVYAIHKWVAGCDDWGC